MNNHNLLTRKEVMERLRLRPAFFSKLSNGKVKGMPALPAVRIGRRQLFREAALNQWIMDVEKLCNVAP